MIIAIPTDMIAAKVLRDKIFSLTEKQNIIISPTKCTCFGKYFLTTSQYVDIIKLENKIANVRRKDL